MFRLVVAAALAVAVCVGALTAPAAGQDLAFSLFDGDVPQTFAAEEPLAFSLFEAPPVAGEVLCFSLFDAAASAAKEPRPRADQVLCFKGKRCVHCKATDDTLAALKHRKPTSWTVGPEVTNQIRVVDVDENPDLARKYGVDAIPVWVKLEHGFEVERRVGYLDPFAVGRLYTGEGRHVASRD